MTSDYLQGHWISTTLGVSQFFKWVYFFSASMKRNFNMFSHFLGGKFSEQSASTGYSIFSRGLWWCKTQQTNFWSGAVMGELLYFQHLASTKSRLCPVPAGNTKKNVFLPLKTSPKRAQHHKDGSPVVCQLFAVSTTCFWADTDAFTLQTMCRKEASLSKHPPKCPPSCSRLVSLFHISRLSFRTQTHCVSQFVHSPWQFCFTSFSPSNMTICHRWHRVHRPPANAVTLNNRRPSVWMTCMKKGLRNRQQWWVWSAGFKKRRSNKTKQKRSEDKEVEIHLNPH